MMRSDVIILPDLPLNFHPFVTRALLGDTPFGALSRFASDTVMPRYVDFQEEKVPSDIPDLRQRSAHFAPASCSVRMLIICSSWVRPLISRALVSSGGNYERQVSMYPLW